jgi:hypothetical protein
MVELYLHSPVYLHGVVAHVQLRVGYAIHEMWNTHRTDYIDYTLLE